MQFVIELTSLIAGSLYRMGGFLIDVTSQKEKDAQPHEPGAPFALLLPNPNHTNCKHHMNCDAIDTLLGNPTSELETVYKSSFFASQSSA